MSVRLLFILVLSVLAVPAGADPAVNLHAADVLVHDQGGETRAAALKDALAQVLVKITGSQAVLETAEAAALLENPARFLQQYRYEAVQPAPADPAAPRLVLRADFDGTALEQRLRAAGFPLWGRERPLTLAWVAFSDGGDRHIVDRDATAPVSDALQRAAARRGLPFVLPEMDSEDATRVTFMDVWGVFEDPLLAAGARYAPDAVLVGSIFNAGNGIWAGRWTVLREGARERFELNGASAQAVAVAAIDMLAERYAQEFAVGGVVPGEGRVALEITAVDALRDYAAVQSYLSGLSVVKDARLAVIDGDVLRFELELNGAVRALEQSIALGRLLEPLPVETVVRLGPAPAADAAGQPDIVTEASTMPQPETPLLRYRYRG